MQSQDHFVYNPDQSASFIDQSKWFQQRLVYKTSEIEKQTHDFGKTFTLRLSPTYFLSTVAGAGEGTEGLLLFDTSQPNASPTFFTNNEWFKDREKVTKTKEIYHPAYKNLCPVLRNAPKNPIVLKRQKDCDPLSSLYISNIIITQFNDGSVNYQFETVLARLSLSSSSTITSNDSVSCVKGHTYDLSFDAMQSEHHGSSLTNRAGRLKINGSASTSASDLIDLIGLLCGQFLYKYGSSLHKSYVKIYRLLDDDLSYWLSYRSLAHEDQPIVDIMREWHEQLKANPAFYDLPFGEIELLNLYNDIKGGLRQVPELADKLRESILIPLRAGDTKAATDACFYGFSYPKSIKKLLLKTELLSFHKQHYRIIHECVENMGVDRTLWFLTDVNNVGQPDYALIGDSTAVKAFSVGFNVNVLKKMQLREAADSKQVTQKIKEKLSYIGDIVEMYEHLVAINVPLDFAERNLNYTHNYLANLYTFHTNVNSGAEMDAMKRVDTSQQSKRYEAGEYIIRSPYTASELITVGISMSNCVAVYIGRFYYRQIDILLLTDKAGAYLGCIEVFDNHVVQAKLKYDKRLCSNADYLKLVVDYMAQNNLKASSLDFGEDQSLHKLINKVLPHKDLDRLNSVALLAS